VPGAINYSKVYSVFYDSCEGARFSCYIDSDMVMVPCSFDAKLHYGVKLGKTTIEQAWNSREFEEFRNNQKNACPGCENRKVCMGGCPLVPEITLCGNRKVPFRNCGSG
jgi:radical SAM protein with 4Fe4S-binding SPASM domain